VILYIRGRLEHGRGMGVKRDFHFSPAPTVTAGFNGFSFDIRK
jgi:hypothetical protein